VRDVVEDEVQYDMGKGEISFAERAQIILQVKYIKKSLPLEVESLKSYHNERTIHCQAFCGNTLLYFVESIPITIFYVTII
jgi:hypothetical protein